MTISSITVIRIALLPMQAAAFGGLCHLPDGMAAVEQYYAAAAAASPRQLSPDSVFWGIEQHGSLVYKPTAAAHLVPLGCAVRQGQVSLALRCNQGSSGERFWTVLDPAQNESAVSALQSAYAQSCGSCGVRARAGCLQELFICGESLGEHPDDRLGQHQ